MGWKITLWIFDLYCGCSSTLSKCKSVTPCVCITKTASYKDIQIFCKLLDTYVTNFTSGIKGPLMKCFFSWAACVQNICLKHIPTPAICLFRDPAKRKKNTASTCLRITWYILDKFSGFYLPQPLALIKKVVSSPKSLTEQAGYFNHP